MLSDLLSLSFFTENYVTVMWNHGPKRTLLNLLGSQLNCKTSVKCHRPKTNERKWWALSTKLVESSGIIPQLFVQRPARAEYKELETKKLQKKMGLASQVATISLILLFALDVFTDVATGVELILNDKPFCEFFFVRLWAVFVNTLIMVSSFSTTNLFVSFFCL